MAFILTSDDSTSRMEQNTRMESVEIGDGDGQHAEQRKRAMQTKACDVCRRRKIKCVPVEHDPTAPSTSTSPVSVNTRREKETQQCVGCKTLGLTCTYQHVKRRPGRPNSFAPHNNSSQSQPYNRLRASPSSGAIRGIGRMDNNKDIGSSGTWSLPITDNNNNGIHNLIHTGPYEISGRTSISTQDGGGNISYARGSIDEIGYPLGYTSDSQDQLTNSHQPPINGSTSSNPALTSHQLDYGGSSYSLALNDHSPSFSSPSAPGQGGGLLGDGTRSWATASRNGGGGLQGGLGNGNSSSSISGGIPSGSGVPPPPPPPPLNSILNQSLPSINPFLHPPLPQIEDVASFSTVFFFISLYLRHLHSHTPVVHKPTFTQMLAMRIDQRDEEFRALLLSLTSYVISQSPKSRMIEHYSQEELERLQARCYQASQLLQTRKYRNPGLVQLGTLLADYFYCTSTGRATKASAILGEAAALCYRMGIHDESRMRAAGFDPIQLELRRRCFWHWYAIDKTEQSAGMPSYMQDFEGVPDLPAAVDDDFITTQGMFPQPASRPSTMMGFVAVTKLFRIMSECLYRHRMIKHRPYGVGRNAGDEFEETMDWIEAANVRIANIFDELPEVLRGSKPLTDGSSGLGDDERAVFGMQRANVIITIASIKFALYDLRETVEANEDVVTAEQEAVSRSMYELLSSVELTDLAANGESMRGKIIRIVIALLNRASTPDQWSASLGDWWSTFTAIQFVQVIPRSLGSVMNSREGTPVREVRR